MKTTIRKAKIAHDLLVAAAVFLGELAMTEHLDRAAFVGAIALAVKALARLIVVGEDTTGESA